MCIHICNVSACECDCVETVIFIQGARECLRHFTQLSQSPVREEVALFVSESEFCVGVEEQLLGEPSPLLHHKHAKEERVQASQEPHFKG